MNIVISIDEKIIKGLQKKLGYSESMNRDDIEREVLELIKGVK